MATENTHSQLVAGAGGTAAGDTTIGQIILPAGGPWTIHHAFGLLARATATAGEANAGSFRLQSASGDLKPNPAPSRFPIAESGSFLGALADVPMCPLAIFPVNYEAAGKAAIDLIYRQDSTVTVAPQLVLGVMFGKTAPEPRPIVFSDMVRAAVTSAADTALGTITISENATRITGVYALAIQDGVITAAEELIGFVRLASDDVDLTPMQIPFAAAYGAGLGATIANNNVPSPLYISLDIPVPGGARIQAFCDLNTAVTNAAEVQLFLAYE
jgi:hypothetical protein